MSLDCAGAAFRRLALAAANRRAGAARHRTHRRPRSMSGSTASWATRRRSRASATTIPASWRRIRWCAVSSGAPCGWRPSGARRWSRWPSRSVGRCASSMAAAPAAWRTTRAGVRRHRDHGWVGILQPRALRPLSRLPLPASGGLRHRDRARAAARHLHLPGRRLCRLRRGAGKRGCRSGLPASGRAARSAGGRGRGADADALSRRQSG